MKELKYNVQLLFKKKEFYISILIILFINLFHAFLCIRNSISLDVALEQTRTGEYQFILYNALIQLTSLIIIVLPIVSAMVFADSSWIENKTKITNMIFFRLNYRKNIFIRFIMNILITMVILFLGFMFNYLVLRIVYGTGNRLSFWSDLGFKLEYNPAWFLENIRIMNPVLFVILISLSVSFVLGLLSGISYLLSFFIKKRVVIYFIPFLLIILSEVILSFLGFNVSLLTFLQPFSMYGIRDFLVGCLLLIMISVFLLLIILKKKDVLL